MRNKLKQLAGYAAAILAVVLGLHLAWSGVVVAAANYWYRDRIFDVHRLKDGEAEKQWVSSFIKDRIDGRTVAVGSSFTFAYPLDEQYTYTSALNRSGHRTLNVSATGYSIRGLNDTVVCPLIQHGKKIKTLIVEIPLINEVAAIKSEPSRATISECPKFWDYGLYLFALLHPRGISWVSTMRDQFHGANPYETVSIGPVPDGYFIKPEQFEKARSILLHNMKAIHENARQVSDNVILWVTPVYFDGVTQAGRDGPSIKSQFDVAQDICRQIAGANCVDTGSIIHRENFDNMTHFNGNGAGALANLLASAIRP